MKNLFVSAVIAGLIALCGCGRTLSVPRTVENPVVEGQNSDVLTVTGVDVTDSTTVLRFHCDFKPGYWIRVSSGAQIEADGVRYQLLSSEGITPDSLLVMPESGQTDFSLVFPAIPGSTESIDFIESDDLNGWIFWGIDLTGATEPSWLKKIPEKLRKGADLNAPMLEAVMDTGVTRVEILTVGYKSGMPSGLNLYYESLGAPSREAGIKLDSLGRCVYETWLAGTTRMFLFDEKTNKCVGEFWLAPGEKATVYLAPLQANRSLAEKYPRFYTDGYYTPVNEAYMLAVNDFGYTPEFSYQDSADEYFEKLSNYYMTQSDSIQSSDYPLMSKALAMDELKQMVLRYASSPASELEYRFYRTKGWNSEFSLDSLKFTKLSSEQLQRIGALFDVSSPDLLMVNYGKYGTMGVDWSKYGATTNLPTEFAEFSKIIASPEDITSQTIDSLRGFSSPFFAAAADGYKAEYDKLMQYSADMGLLPTPDVDVDKLFDEITAPHKGKVVMVDLWNTWCGPCRRAIAANEPEKDGELSSEDIVWIYIANETSPIEKYLQMIPDIRGLHYRLNSEQWKQITERFGVDGIPFYVLVDRDGNAVGRPDLRNHDLFKKELLNKLNGK